MRLSAGIKSLFLAGAFFSTAALAAQNEPSSIKVNRGTHSGQILSLKNKDEGRTFKIYSDRRGNVIVALTFSTSGLNTSSLRLEMNARALNGSLALDVEAKSADGSFVKIGTFSLTGAFGDVSVFVPAQAVVNGTLTVRLRAGLTLATWR
ncbi:MAG: hypothetical protein HC902_04605 [Calothrix sp. SM1_5_4]|nr:hypothetical protein [Calothrix sp. SM1_5_4]